ncbi:uncharacterized protein LOC134531760 isoform X5 [Bacillus rossius redtenbacheri]|uniref:uncharacterized protein LOC134531760 isoform X5 n=1 Tax=Bacillus rossius redtenbacheri TaxID=93214 RepID=UPI002FDCEEA6
MPKKPPPSRVHKRTKLSKAIRALRKKNKERITCEESRTDGTGCDDSLLPEQGPSRVHEVTCETSTQLETHEYESGEETIPDSDEWLPQLTVTTEPAVVEITGRRIVNISHLLKQLTELAKHGNVCTQGQYKITSERRVGVMSYLYYECIMCEKTVTVTTEEDTRKEEVNDAFVWGALSVGIGHYQSQEMMAILDVPIMDKRKWQRHEIRIEEVWEEKLETYMQKNGTVERKKALERGHVDNDGVPYISVYVDGAWCKRTYGHAFNAASGVVEMVYILVPSPLRNQRFWLSVIYTSAPLKAWPHTS